MKSKPNLHLNTFSWRRLVARVASGLGCVLALLSQCAQAQPEATYVGNSLSTAGGPDTSPPLVILGEYSSSGPLATPSPATTLPYGNIQDVKFYGQNYSFTLYALRYVTTGAHPNEQIFQVVGTNVFSGTASSAGIQTLAVSNISVMPGDLLAFAGTGPYFPQTANDANQSDATYQNPSSVQFTATAPGGPGTLFTNGIYGDANATYDYIPNTYNNQGRTYSIGVDVFTNNLVQNASFETGDFTDWTETGNVEYTSVSTLPIYAHAGLYGAQSGPDGSLGFISQQLPTVPGQSYVISFWLDSPDGENPNQFLMQWGTNVLYNQTNLAKAGWQKLEFVAVATSNSTTLEFGFRDDPSYLGLDDITVTPVVDQLVASVVVTNTVPVLYDSDSNRNFIGVNSTNVLTNLFSGVLNNVTNVASYRLLDTNGVAYPIYDVTGQTNSAYTYNVTNILSFAAMQTNPLVGAPHLRTAVPIEPYTPYAVEMRTFENGIFTGLIAKSATNLFLEFTNLLGSGDPSLNAVGLQGNQAWTQVYAVQTVPGLAGFQAQTLIYDYRYDNFNAAVTVNPVTNSLTFSLYRASDNSQIPLQNSTTNFVINVPSYTSGTPPTYAVGFGTATIILEPNAQIDSVNDTYYAVISLSVNEDIGMPYTAANSVQLPTQELLDFNGTLNFNNVPTTITALNTAPPANLPSGGVIPTTLNNVSAGAQGEPNRNFANAGPFGVNLDSSGNAIVTSGSVALNAPSPDRDSIAGVNFTRGQITLNSLGGTANGLTIILPVGLGYNSTENSPLQSAFTLGGAFQLIGPNLAPNFATLGYVPGGTFYVFEESQPVWFPASQLLWEVQAGQFVLIPPPATAPQYVCLNQFQYLQSVSGMLSNPSAAIKRSNEEYWLALTGSVGDPLVMVGPQSNSLLNTTFNFGPGSFQTHFPYAVPLSWGGAGSMTVNNDIVVSGQLTTFGPITNSYLASCTGCGGTTTTESASIYPVNATLEFTPDGGLIAEGTNPVPMSLEWGYSGGGTFAQSVSNFFAADFHMPGTFVEGQENELPSLLGPATILYTGFSADLTLVERPLSAAYNQGFADYAGLNFRCSNYLQTASSTIAGSGPYGWTPDNRSKYYVRFGGVSGIDEAELNTFPSSLTLWGYAFTVTSYGLSYQLNQVYDSIVDGSIGLPCPAGFTEQFQNLQFNCAGAPSTAQVPSNEPTNVMKYWNAEFQTESLQFETTYGCDPSAGGYLVLGIQGWASHVPQPLFGLVGFFTNGDQIPPSFNLPNVTSRLKLPNVISITGPTNEGSYSFTPVQDAYYDTFTNSPAQTSGDQRCFPLNEGWLNLYGTLSVPFFNALQVQWQTSCLSTNDPAASLSPIWLSGGWPTTGWTDPAGNTPFQTNLFDASNVGWPYSPSYTIDQYRNDTNSPNFHPRAQKDWLGNSAVFFDYPLSWSSPLRTFQSWQPLTNDFFVISLQHQLTYMDPTKVDLSFGFQYGLADLHLANLGYNLLGGQGISQAIIQGAGQPIESALTTGMDELNELLDARLDPLMTTVFTNVVDPIVAQFYTTITNGWSANQGPQFLPNVVFPAASNLFAGAAGAAPPANTLSNALLNLANNESQMGVSNLLTQVVQFLSDATNAVQAILGTVTAKNGQGGVTNALGFLAVANGNRPVLSPVAQAIVGNLLPAWINAMTASNAMQTNSTLENIFKAADPIFVQLSNNLSQVQFSLGLIIQDLTNTDETSQELNAVLSQDTMEMSNVAAQVAAVVTNYFGQFEYPLDNPFASTSLGDLQNLVRQAAVDQFCASAAASQVQASLRQRLYDLDASLRDEMEEVFQQINQAIADLIGETLDVAGNAAEQALLGTQIGGLIGAANLNGTAEIDGNSLKDLKISGGFDFKPSTNALKFQGSLDIKELSSKGTPNGCSSFGAASGTEVTISATKVPLNWISPGLSVSVSTTFAFTSDNGNFEPLNLAGQLTLGGNLSYGGGAFTLHDLGVALAFGEEQDYLALTGGVKFSGYDFSGGLFVGQTCTLSPLALINPNVTNVLGNTLPLSGAYVYAQGWLPISQLILGIPPTCVFTISAGVGAGLFYFTEGPTVGGQMFLGVSGQFLCLVSLTANVNMTGVDQGGQFNFDGTGHFAAQIGPCPFCLNFSKDVGISYDNNNWSLH